MEETLHLDSPCRELVLQHSAIHAVGREWAIVVSAHLGLATRKLSGLGAEKRVRGSLRGAERSRSFLRTCPAATKTRGQGEQRGVRE